MKKKHLYIGAIIIGLVIVGYFAMRFLDTERTVSLISIETIDATNVPLTFSYPSGEAGYSLVEPLSRSERLENWAIANQNITSFTMAKETPEVAKIDGVKALRYTADGLYQQDVYLASYRGYVYMFVGQYDSPDDPIRTVFSEVISSIALE